MSQRPSAASNSHGGPDSAGTAERRSTVNPQLTADEERDGDLLLLGCQWVLAGSAYDDLVIRSYAERVVGRELLSLLARERVVLLDSPAGRWRRVLSGDPVAPLTPVEPPLWAYRLKAAAVAGG